MKTQRRGFDKRTSGLLLHITSLPGPHGNGDLGGPAHAFVDFLAQGGQSWWQMLPTGPQEAPPSNSPYSCSSAMAGSPDLVSLDCLAQLRLLSPRDLKPKAPFPAARVDFPAAHAFRESRLRKAYLQFRRRPGRLKAAFAQFCRKQRAWLEGFALFCALKAQHNHTPWLSWPEPVRLRHPSALRRARKTLADEINYHRFIQFMFQIQWDALRKHANDLGIGLIGDIPIFVAPDSADVWCQQDLFQLDPTGAPRFVSGYPPDAFNSLGQRWGHPQYDWDAHRRTRFAWWIARFQRMYDLFDSVRIDHFLGFTRLWSTPADSPNARKGRWIPVPGSALFAALKRALGPCPILVEDLGRVTRQAEKLRDGNGFHGMRVVQFGFGDDAFHRPHRFIPNSAVYTGTHDNETLVGWFKGLKRGASRRRALAYAGGSGRQVHWDFIRLAMNSVANTVLFPVQDILGLDNRARMNMPGTPTGNWEWRLTETQLKPAAAKKLRLLTEAAERLSTPPKI